MVGSPGTADGHYYWTGRLPSAKSGRHIIYSVWSRSDSTETFYGCSDVTFDGGHGEVTGVGTTDPGPSTSASASASPRPSSSSSPPSSSSPAPPAGNAGCTATYQVTNSWQGGFQAQVTVANPGTTAINGWRAGWNWGSAGR